MIIEQEDNGKTGSFFIAQEGEQLALMTYTWTAPDVFTIEHTEVDDVLEGKGIGKQLVQRAVQFAREKSSKIIAQCPFVKAVIHKTPEYQDVLK